MVQPHTRPHRGRLAGAVRSQESGHLAGLDAKRQGVHGERVAVSLGQVHDLDHAVTSSLSTQRSRDGGGTGPGLSIVAAVVAAHGGSVHIESGPGRTAVTVLLPRTQTPDAHSPPPPGRWM